MTKHAMKADLAMAERLLNESVRVHLSQTKQVTEYNLNLALVHICRALERIANDVDTIEHKVG